jgi:DNA polymerase III subunit epsilon
VPSPSPSKLDKLGLDAKSFVALDFETADRGPDSACSVGLVRVQDGHITQRHHFLIRPPRSAFEFTWVHGITWQQVEHQPSFSELWPEVASLLQDTELLVAHNASFDRTVLRACCFEAGQEPPSLEFACTVKIARCVWNMYPTKLPNVCANLGFTVQHHDALADAEACAKIMIAAQKEYRAAN